MGAGASAVGKASGAEPATITAQVQALNAQDKLILMAAFEASAGGDTKSIAANVNSIAENEAKIHELSLSVMTNKQGIFEARAMMEENRANVMQNYQAATTGNRQMALENSDAVMRNRFAILKSLKVNGPIEENFRKSKVNESNIEYLQNQCLLNNRVAKVNVKMSAANAEMIAANDLILSSNEEIVKFNTEQINTNKLLLDGPQADKMTPEANAARIAANSEKIAKIKERNDKYNGEMAPCHAAIKENRQNIAKNADSIKERRKEILANRKTIDENGLKVAEMLRMESFAEVASGIDGLSEDEKKALKEAVSGAAESEAGAANRKEITENEATLHALHLNVTTNQSKLLNVRSIIEENRSILLKNYSAAFAGNRLMINQNTDSIFKNRIAILNAMKLEGQVQENFRRSKKNEAKIEFLEHRSLLNNRVAKTNAKIAAANTNMIEANNNILEGNEELKKFNTASVETNTKLLTGIQADKATVESNAARIAANTAAIKMIEDHASKYDSKVDDNINDATDNRMAIIQNSGIIDVRRKEIIANRDGILAVGVQVVNQIRGAPAAKA